MCVTACGIMHPQCCRPVARLPVGSIVGALYHKLQTQSSAPEDGRNYRPKHFELIGIINKPLLLLLVGCLYYCNRLSGCSLGIRTQNPTMNVVLPAKF